MPTAVMQTSPGFQAPPVAPLANNASAEVSNPDASTSDKTPASADATNIFGALTAELPPEQVQNSTIDGELKGDVQACLKNEIKQLPIDALSAEQWLQQMLGQQQAQVQARDAQPVVVQTDLQGVTSAIDKSDDKTVAEQSEKNIAASESTDITNAADTTTIPALLVANSIAPILPVVNSGKSEIKVGDANNLTTNSITRFEANSAEKFSATVSPALTNTADDATQIAESRTGGEKIIAENQGLSSQVTQMSSQLAGSISGNVAAQPTNQLAAIQNSTVMATDTGINQSHLESSLKLQTPEAKWGEQLLHALRDNVHVQLQQRMQNATIRLDPPELGSLEIFLSHESGRLTVQISASQADVARLLQNTSDRLRQDLAGPQFTEVNVQTSSDNQAGQQRSRQDARPLFTEEPVLAAAPSSATDKQKLKGDSSGNLLVSV